MSCKRSDLKTHSKTLLEEKVKKSKGARSGGHGQIRTADLTIISRAL